MKKLLFILSAIALVSCGSNEEPIIPIEPPMPETPKEHTVYFGFFGEITDIEESPLNRAVSSNLYGIQAYSMSINDKEYKPYAYGLFDDKSKMAIKLLEGYKYKFCVTMLEDKTKLLTNKIEGVDAYEYPFINTKIKATKKENKFIYSSTVFLNYLISSYTTLIKERYEIPNIDRYFGEVMGYTITENEQISIDMRRVVFGAKFIVEGLTEGKVIITLNGAPEMCIVYPNLETQDIFTLPNATAAGDYSTTIPVAIKWEKNDGSIIPLATQEIVFKRNKLTTATIKVKDNSANIGMNISKDETPMGDGGNITIETGTGTDTGIDLKP